MFLFVYISRLEKSGIQQPAHTVLGRLDQARRWLEQPALDDRYNKFLFKFFLLVFP